jgi:Zn-dependent protease
MKGHLILLLMLVLSALFITPVSALDLQQIYIELNNKGDATVTLAYQTGFLESLGFASQVKSVQQNLEEHLGGVLGREVHLACTGTGGAKLTILRFAEVQGDRFQIPEVNFASLFGGLSSSSLISYRFLADVTIVFPDGSIIQEHQTPMIHPVSYTLTGRRAVPPPPPLIQCSQEKNLPIAPFVPPEAVPVAAAATGTALSVVALSGGGQALSALFSKITNTIYNLIGQQATETLQDRAKAGRAQVYSGMKAGAILGFSPIEFAVVILGAFLLGFAFFFAGREAFDPIILVIFVLVGGLTTFIHEIAHWAVARRFGSESELEFWGIGTVVMFFTAWLFGNVFAQPSLTVIRSEEPLEKRHEGLMMLAGPLASLLCAFLCLPLKSFGGYIATAGSIGFSMNLLSCLFPLLPLKPLDGEGVFKWSKLVWCVIFIPLLLGYFIVNI